jgi:hypothetical protein
MNLFFGKIERVDPKLITQASLIFLRIMNHSEEIFLNIKEDLSCPLSIFIRNQMLIINLKILS